MAAELPLEIGGLYLRNSSHENLIDFIWKNGKDGLQSTNNEIVLPLKTVSFIGPDSVEKIKNLLRYGEYE